MPEFDPVALLRVLSDHDVDFLVVGGVAARLRGAPILTEDVDITPAGDRANLDRLVAALEELQATLRTPDEPDGVEFPLDPALLAQGSMWTLATRHGDLDLVFSPEGTGGYRDLIRDADLLRVALDPHLEVAVASLADVVRSKEAAGREKDRAALPMLRRAMDEVARRPEDPPPSR